MRSWWSRGARTRRTRKGTTIATTISTSRGKRSRATGRRWSATSTNLCAACPIGRRTWTNVQSWPHDSRRRRGTVPGCITGSQSAYTADEMLGSGCARDPVDFITSPGHGASRRQLGMPGAGPVKVITDKAVLEVDEATGELVLAALYPGVEASDVRARVGWPLQCRSRLGRVEPPTATELRLLRDVLDPERRYLQG